LPTREKTDDNVMDRGEDEVNRESLSDVRPILKVIEGNIVQKTEDLMKDYGGSPRGWSRLEDFSLFDDVDPVDSAVWLSHLNPKMPMALVRKRKLKGGALAIVRDISSSMTGSRAQWSSMLILGLIRIARKRRMRLGYVEFNHQSIKFLRKKNFFNRSYTTIGDMASRCRCSGFTNYQLPLLDAIKEFKSVYDRIKHVVFITDGRPTEGDREIAREIKLAQRDKIAVHSIYIGKKESPEILRVLSKRTGGSHFQVGPDDSGTLRLKTLT
jgi:uncharacterized protein with von Willebrand factor type A (vWA) domain